VQKLLKISGAWEAFENGTSVDDLKAAAEAEKAAAAAAAETAADTAADVAVSADA